MNQYDYRRRVSVWLIRIAAHTAPAELSLRLEEEWLADLYSRKSKWAGLTLAVGCCWASTAISKDRANREDRAPAPLPSVAALKGGVFVFGDPKLSYVSLRPVTVFLILELHAALACGLLLPL